MDEAQRPGGYRQVDALLRRDTDPCKSATGSRKNALRSPCASTDSAIFAHMDPDFVEWTRPSVLEDIAKWMPFSEETLTPANPQRAVARTRCAARALRRPASCVRCICASDVGTYPPNGFEGRVLPGRQTWGSWEDSAEKSTATQRAAAKVQDWLASNRAEQGKPREMMKRLGGP
ncbi:unnamed protein product [Symbiodinium sp. CCMP2592]|nr:unnamed protein product [Symbiodinium sp. CCMP2592]